MSQRLLVVLNREIVQYIDTGAEFINYCIAVMMNKDCLVDITIPLYTFNRWIKNIASKRHVMFDVVDGIIGVPITLHFIQRYYITITLMYQCLRCSSATPKRNIAYTEMNQSIQVDTASYPIPILIRNSSMHPNVTASVRFVQSFSNDGSYHCLEAVGMSCKCTGGDQYTDLVCSNVYCTSCSNTKFIKCVECDSVNVCISCYNITKEMFFDICGCCKRCICLGDECVRKARYLDCSICGTASYCDKCNEKYFLIAPCDSCDENCCGSCSRINHISERICFDC